MSGEATGWVLRHGPKDRAMRAVLVTIADAANRDGENAFPGLPAMVEGSGYGRATVFSALAKLTEGGWLKVTEQGKGRGHSTVYSIPGVRAEKVQSLDASDAEKVQERSKKGPRKVQSSDSPPYLPNDNGNDNEVRARRFARWWDRYPKRNGKRLGRAEAERIWNGLTEDDHHAAWVGIRFYAQACDAGLTLAKDPARWLKGRCWVDWQEPASAPVKANGTAKLTNVEQGMANIDSIFEGLEHR